LPATATPRSRQTSTTPRLRPALVTLTGSALKPGVHCPRMHASIWIAAMTEAEGRRSCDEPGSFNWRVSWGLLVQLLWVPCFPWATPWRACYGVAFRKQLGWLSMQRPGVHGSRQLGRRRELIPGRAAPARRERRAPPAAEQQQRRRRLAWPVWPVVMRSCSAPVTENTASASQLGDCSPAADGGHRLL